MVVAWLLFPGLVAILCLGAGLLLEQASAGSLPGVLVLPAGMAAIVVTTRIATYWSATARLATPLVVATAVVGIVVWAVGDRRLRPDPWAAATVLAVFAVFAAPVVLSGDASFAGYGLLGDTAVHF